MVSKGNTSLVICCGVNATIAILIFQFFGWKTTALVDSLLVGIGFPLLVGIINSYHEDDKDSIQRNGKKLESIEKHLEVYQWQKQENAKQLAKLEEVLDSSNKRILIVENKLDLYQQLQIEFTQVINELRVTLETHKFYCKNLPEKE